MRTWALLPLLSLVVGCSGGTTPDRGGTDVLAAAYPFAWAAERVAGSDAQVRNLVDPGVEPHDVELTPRQVQAIGAADLVVYLKGFQPAVDDAVRDVPSDARLDLLPVSDVQTFASALEGDGEGGPDPHVWLDPLRMQRIVEELGRRLAEADPDNAAGYRERATATAAELGRLHEELDRRLKSCARRDLVTAHTAFGYLASRYGLTQVGAAGLDPEADPSPGRLAKVARFAKQRGVTTVFFESLVDPKVAQTVAREIGATTAVLDPIEGVEEGDDYLSVMRRNGDALGKALGCR